MRKSLSITILAVVLFASCRKSNDLVPTGSTTAEQATVPSEENAGLQKSSQSSKSLPFSGSMTYYFSTEVDLPCDCGEFAVAGNYSGTGNLAHLGATTSIIKPCIAPIIYQNQQIGVHVGQECGSFVAANGDELYCDTHPYDMFFTNAGAVGVVKIDFVGGTGKFKNASGSFTGYTTNDGNKVTLKVLKGSISY